MWPTPTTVPRVIVGTVLLPGGTLRRAAVRVTDGRISAVEPEPTSETLRSLSRDGVPLQLPARHVLAPAFLDIHCHGAGGGSAHGNGASLERMARALATHGVGAFLATTMTAPIPELRRAARLVARTRERQRPSADPSPGAQLLGLHLEGPALAPTRSAGHDPSALLSAQGLQAALSARPDDWRAVRVVTMAPELEGGPRLVQHLAAAGIVASLGHTDASDEIMTVAYGLGARSTTHLFNGMRPLHHRSPGPIGVALAAAPFIELICDGVHIADHLLAPMARAIGDERLVLVSDASPLAGSRLRRLTLRGVSARLEGDRVVDAEGELAGSRLLLDGMVHHATQQGIPLGTALRAATENPARLLGLGDRGVIAVDAVAELAVVTDRGRFKRLLGAGGPREA